MEAKRSLILDSIFDYFSSSPEGLIFSLPEVAANLQHPLNEQLGTQLSLIPDALVKNTRPSDQYLLFAKPYQKDHSRNFRLWILNNLLSDLIPISRLSYLVEGNLGARSKPYDHPALLDLAVDDDNMVPLSEFKVEGYALRRNGYSFSMIPSVLSPNAPYWFLQSILKFDVASEMKVRLDPFVVRPDEEFPTSGFYMWWYGKKMDWDRISSLSEEDHGRWFPDWWSTDAEFTDFVWSPRGREIHFQCEELPILADIKKRGSRYLHAIYDAQNHRISHFDGAIRIYEPDSWNERTQSHVRKAGKAGVRIKLFKIDTEISREVFSSLSSGFFVWNHDMLEYLGETTQ